MNFWIYSVSIALWFEFHQTMQEFLWTFVCLGLFFHKGVLIALFFMEIVNSYQQHYVQVKVEKSMYMQKSISGQRKKERN